MLALYSLFLQALKLLYRARYLSLLVLGENHPEVALIDSNIGLILHAVGEYDLSLKFLEKALELNLKYHGAKSLKVKHNSAVKAVKSPLYCQIMLMVS